MKLTTHEIKFDEILDGKVKPFSDSAHIPFSKKYLGMAIKIIIPIPRMYFWVLSDEEKKELIDTARKVKIREGMYSQPRREDLKQAIKNFSKATWGREDLAEILIHIEDLKEINKIIKKVKKIYDFI